MKIRISNDAATGERRPQQSRSRQTRQQLFRAAEELFAERGIEAVAIAELADRAGIAVGTFYGRFASKSAFLSAFFEDFFARGAEATGHLFGEIERSETTAAGIARRFVDFRLRHYREHRALIHAVVRHVRTRSDPSFAAPAARYAEAVIARLLGLFEPHLGAVAHPNPELAIRFGIGAIEALLKDAVARGTDRSPTFAFDDDVFATELTRLLLRYLGLETAA